MDRAQKEKLVDELAQIFESSGVVVVSHYAGLTVAEMQDLRARMREAGGSVRVAKNRLAKIALGHGRSESRRLDAVPRGAYRFHRRLYRGARQQHRRGHWRTCFEHREHSFDNRGARRGRVTLGPRKTRNARWNTPYGMEMNNG